MTKGEFSNSGKDTFDASKQYIGIRLQQGVPLLDRDWNELEDIRRYFERMLRRHYIGQGIPDNAGFRISAPTGKESNDFVIGAGRCMVNGYDVYNPTQILYSAQPGGGKLKKAERDEVLVVFLTVDVDRIDSTDDPDLLNSQDINIETCVRDKLTWRVGVARSPMRPFPGTFRLAEIRRKAGTKVITDDMVKDRRRTNLNLVSTVDGLNDLKTRVENLSDTVSDIQLDIEGIKTKLGKLFWDIELKASKHQALFGEKVRIVATVVDNKNKAVNGAHLAFSADWGSIEPATAVTGRNGVVAVELIGLKSDTPPPKAEIAVMQKIVHKVQMAAFKNPGTIEYKKIRFEPQEMQLVSKYSPSSAFLDLSRNFPSGPIVAIPTHRTVSVTVYAKEGNGAIVRGTGNIQVGFGMWVRDWAQTKVWDIVSNVVVSTQVADLMRKGVVQKKFNSDIVTEALPETMESIHNDIKNKFKTSILIDPTKSDSELTQTGMLGQVIAQEATAAVGFKTNQAVEKQLKRFEKEGIKVEFDKAKTKIVQTSSEKTAGYTQRHKQEFNSPG